MNLVSDIAASLKSNIQDMRARNILRGILPILIIFVTIKLISSVLQQLIKMSGGGLSAPHTVSGEALPGFGLSGPVTQTQIKDALPDTFIRLDWAGLDSAIEVMPALAWVFLASYLLAWLPPYFYFIAHILRIGGVTPWQRTLAKWVTAISGGIFLFGLLFSNGYSVVRPDQIIWGAGGALIYGALCVHLYSDPDTRLRKWGPRIFIACIAGAALVMNFIFTGKFFGQVDPEFSSLGETLTNAYMSGWVRALHDAFSQSQPLIIFISVVWLVPFLTYGLFKDKIVKRSPALHMILAAGFWILTISLFASISGMFVFLPSTLTIGLLGFIWIGMAIFTEFETTDGQAQYFSTLLDKAEAWLDTKIKAERQTP